MKNFFFLKDSYSNIYKSCSETSEVTSQILYGEKFKILSKKKSWLKIKTAFDNYVGYIRDVNYTNYHKPTHKVFNIKANIFNKQKNKTRYFLPFASRISIIQESKKFIEFEKNKWIKKSDVKNINHMEKDYLKVLKMFLKTKYVWGGKTYRGIDCSAILQLFFYYNNKFYPRDTKDQIKYSAKKKDIKKIDHKEKDYLKILKLFLKTKYVWGGKTHKGIDCSAILQLLYYYNNKFYPRDTKDQLRYSKNNTKKKKFEKGDVIFWKGHVAICINAKNLIHAYGPEKKVIIMPINKTLKRIERTAKLIIKKVSSIRY